jgi:hypothetical protein
VPYLLRLRRTANVQRLAARQFGRDDWSRPDTQGCRMREARLTPIHGKAVLLGTLIADIHAALRPVRQTAEQFASIDPWTTLVRSVSERIAPSIGPPKPDSAPPATG